MRRPRTTIYAYWLRDVSGEWLLRADTNRGHLIREQRNDADRYEVTAINTFGLQPGEAHEPLPRRRHKEKS